MSPKLIEAGKTYHNGKGNQRKVILIGNRYKDDADIYYEPMGYGYWLPMTLKGFAKWAKGEVSQPAKGEEA